MNQRLGWTRGAIALLFTATSFATAPLAAKDVYKGFLDPGIPHHRAILDTLERLKASPNDAGLHNDLGCLISWDGFWRDALREFSTAAKLAKNDSRPLFNAGIVHAWLGEWGPARHDFSGAKDREPGNWPAWWMLGYAEEKLGNDDAAVAAYKTSLRVDTSLFQVAKNPFAAGTRLKARVLLETIEKRMVRASMPVRQELAGADRIASFFQRNAPPPAAAAPPAREEVLSVPTGPVVTTAPQTSANPPARIIPAPTRGVRSRPAPDPNAEQAAPPPPPPDNLPFQNVTPAPPKKKQPPQPGPGGAPSDEL